MLPLGGREPDDGSPTLEAPICSLEQIAQGTPEQDRHPDLSAVERAVVQHVVPLTPSREIGRRHIRRIMVPVTGREDHPRPADGAGVHDIRPSCVATMIVAPSMLLRIEPAAVRQHPDFVPMWLATGPAAASPVWTLNLEADTL